MKSWIAMLGETYPLTHDIAVLHDVLGACGVDVSSSLSLADDTPFAVAFRYEGVDPDSDRLARDDARRLSGGGGRRTTRSGRKTTGPPRTTMARR